MPIWLTLGYVDVRLATLEGSGTILAKSLATLPQFSPSFTGTIESSRPELAFTLDTRKVPAVTDAIAVPCTIRLPAAVAVSVTCATKPRPGRYALVTAQVIAGVEQWTLNVFGETEQSQPRLVCESGTLFVDIPASGTHAGPPAKPVARQPVAQQPVPPRPPLSPQQPPKCVYAGPQYFNRRTTPPPPPPPPPAPAPRQDGAPPSGAQR